MHNISKRLKKIISEDNKNTIKVEKNDEIIEEEIELKLKKVIREYYNTDLIHFVKNKTKNKKGDEIYSIEINFILKKK